MTLYLDDQFPPPPLCFFSLVYFLGFVVCVVFVSTGGGFFPGAAVLRDFGPAVLLPRAVPGADRREPRTHGTGKPLPTPAF